MLMIPGRGQLLSCANPNCLDAKDFAAEAALAIIRLEGGKAVVAPLCNGDSEEARERGLPVVTMLSLIERDEKRRDLEAVLEAEAARVKALDDFFAATVFVCRLPGCMSDPQPADQMMYVIKTVGEEQKRILVCQPCGAIAHGTNVKTYSLELAIEQEAATTRTERQRTRNQEAERELVRARAQFFSSCEKLPARTPGIGQVRRSDGSGHRK